MKLRFHSRAGNLVALPGGHRTGSAPRYIGRTYDPATRAFPASDEPLVLDGEKHKVLALRLARLMRRDGSILPADEATAQFCQVPWCKPVKQADGEWQLEGHVAGWCDWPNRHPAKLAEDVAKRGDERVKAFAAAGGGATPTKRRRGEEVVTNG